MRPPVPPTPDDSARPDDSAASDASASGGGRSEIACIVDRSGSMDTVRADAIGGFNAFVRAQREEPGEARLTLALFNHEYERPLEHVPLAEVPEMTEATYRPSGTTALHDAIGRTLHDLRARIEGLSAEDRPDSVVVAILTDGMENASRDYTSESVRTAVTACRDAGWEFVFLAAGQDAVMSASRVGIAAADAMPFAANAAGTKAAFSKMAAAVSKKRRR